MKDQKEMINKVKDKFRQLFAADPQCYRAPGRINLIGEHTDYNDGFVMPAAIDRCIIFGLGLNDKGIFRFHAVDLDEYHESQGIASKHAGPAWTSYLFGVIAQFESKGIPVSGLDCVFGGNIPLGAGLSSSAAIECGLAVGIDDLLNAALPRKELALMAQRAEHEYAGVMCGIMDQYASMFGEEGQLFRLDCRTLETEYYHMILSEHVLVLCDTKVKHQLAQSEYNLRRRECEQGVKTFQQAGLEVTALRDVTPAMLQDMKHEMDPVTFKRCLYVTEENERVLASSEQLQAGDLAGFGRLMYASHAGLRDLYEVSCPELDLLVDTAKQVEGVVGSRMMGGGFGGCTISLVHREALDAFSKVSTQVYRSAFGISPDVFTVELSAGAGRILE